MTDVPVTMTVSAKGVDTTTAALAKVTDSVDRMRRMQTSAVAVGNILANVAMRGARQVQAFARESLAGADGIAKSARAFGLSARGYQEMAFASKRSGIEMNALNTGIRSMQSRMVVAGTVARQLGVNFDHLKNLSPEAQFREVGKTLAAIQNPAERTALAVELFGRQGARIAAMAGDFDALSAEAHRLGVVMNDGALNVAERFNDKMGDIKQQFQAVFVNALPDIQLFMQSAYAGLVRVYDIAVAVGTALVRSFSTDSFLPLIINIAEAMNTAFVNTFENLKRLVSATIKWVKGQGFDFNGVGLMEGAKFQKVPALDELGRDIAAANEKYESALQRAADSRVAADNYVIESANGAASALGGVQGADRQRGLEAARFGSVEAASAINRMRTGQGNIEQKQLTQLERIARNTEKSDGGITVKEYAL